HPSPSSLLSALSIFVCLTGQSTPRSSPFPYTTLFRSLADRIAEVGVRAPHRRRILPQAAPGASGRAPRPPALSARVHAHPSTRRDSCTDTARNAGQPGRGRRPPGAARSAAPLYQPAAFFAYHTSRYFSPGRGREKQVRPDAGKPRRAGPVGV